jgi:hypothetical protein
MIFAVGLAVFYGTCLFSVKLSDAILRSGPISQLSAAQHISAMVR